MHYWLQLYIYTHTHSQRCFHFLIFSCIFYRQITTSNQSEERMLVTQSFQYKLWHLNLKPSTEVSLFWEIRPKAEVQTTSSHLPALRQRGGTYTRAQGRQLKWQNLHIWNRKTSQGRCINALIQMTQKLNLFPLHLPAVTWYLREG